MHPDWPPKADGLLRSTASPSCESSPRVPARRLVLWCLSDVDILMPYGPLHDPQSASGCFLLYGRQLLRQPVHVEPTLPPFAPVPNSRLRTIHQEAVKAGKVMAAYTIPKVIQIMVKSSIG